MKKVVIASKNPVKIDSVKSGFTKCFPEVEYDYMGASSPSGVPDQPIGDEQTFTGAMNRVEHIKLEFPDHDYFVGIEGGLTKVGDVYEVFAWVIVSSSSNFGKAKTSTFYLPQAISKLVDEGKELGEADDIVFNRRNSKTSNGSVGILTKDVVTRTDFYTEAVVLALIPHINKDLY